jgi:HlyD family secretion protein
MKIKYLIEIFLLMLVVSACGNGNDKNTIEESGTIETTDVVISAQVAGPVQKLIYDDGTKVSKGDTIMIIDHEKLDLQLKQAIAGKKIAKARLDLLANGARKEDVEQAKQMLKQAKANYESAKKDKERMENLYESNSVTKNQLEDITTGYEVAEAQYKLAQENLAKIKDFARPEELAQARAKYDQATAQVGLIQKSLSDSYIVSPLDGFIVKNFVEEGETISLMSSLVKLSDISKVELVIYVSELDLGKVKLGQKANVSVDTYKDKTYEGKVTYISPEAEFTPKNIQTKDERTKLVFAVKIEIPNPNFDLKAGMPADAEIILN